MTLNPKSTFKSLQYRKRLQNSTSKKEAELMIYVFNQGGEAIIDGYRVTLKDGKLSWEKLPPGVTHQLPFPFVAPQ